MKDVDMSRDVFLDLRKLIEETRQQAVERVKNRLLQRGKDNRSVENEIE